MRYVNIPKTSLSRHIGSKGLVETDRKKAEEYELKSKMLNGNKHAQEEINSIKEKLSEIDSLKSDMNEIKQLLNALVNKG